VVGVGHMVHHVELQTATVGLSAHAAKEVLWLRAFLGEIGKDVHKPMVFHCDNQSTIAICQTDPALPLNFRPNRVTSYKPQTPALPGLDLSDLSQNEIYDPP
jgi:hypothetical protein